MRTAAFLLPALIAVSACAPLAPLPGEGIRKVPSPNFDARRANMVVLHHTSDSTVDEALATLTDPERKVSAHYLIGRDGEILQLVEERDRAWHAGKSWWGGNTDINSVSIGIELDNDGDEPFPDAQIHALLGLLAGIQQRHGIPRANIVGHADVAPGRKVDPSAWFPWRRLAENGFGLWCDEPWEQAPEGLDLMTALTALGYSPLTPEASQQAFLLHYAAGSATLPVDAQRALAFCLLIQRQLANGAGN
jgi:N-acetylmuramoyl-L-alanine amidase